MADDTNKRPQGPGAPTPEEEEVSYAVMPRGDNGDFVSDPHPGSQPPQQRPMSDIVATPIEHPGVWHNKYTYIAIGVLVLAALGAIGYFLVGPSGTKEPSQPATRLSTVFLKQYFGAEKCADEARCGDTADPDADGLENWDELKEQTDPTKNDSDADGLADGDEVFIFLTNPMTEYTDQRPAARQAKYTDGSQVKNDYDPLTPGLKMTETRKQQIATETGKYKLHEPTVTTLASAPAEPEPKTLTVFITNGKFDPAALTLKTGDKVNWINRDTAAHQIASDPHPSHTLLRELESGSLATNQVFNFTFTKAGTFSYHDHLNPTIKGTVTVE